MSKPAFPSTQKYNDGRMPTQHLGMNLRDYFAGQALIGLSMRLCGEDVDNLSERIKGGRIEAKAAYALADALLDERES